MVKVSIRLIEVMKGNGPGVKVRGSAQNIAEKYVQLARDAQASGDHVAFENFMQHAEHYLRLINAANEAMRLANPNWRPEPILSQEEGEEGEEGEEEGQEPQNGSSRRVFDINDDQPSDARGEQPQPRHFEQPRRENNRFQRPRFEGSPAPSEESLEPRAPEQQEGERRPRFNRFERNRNRRPFEPRNDDNRHSEISNFAGEQPALQNAPVQAAPAQIAPVYEAAPLPKPAREPRIRSTEPESFGLPAFITGGEVPKVAVKEDLVPATRRRGRPPRDTSQRYCDS